MSHHGACFLQSGNRCAPASKVSFREWFKGIFMTTIFHRRLFLMRREGGSKGEKTEQEVGRGQISGWLKRPFWDNSVWLEPRSLITILGPTWRRVLTVWALAIKSCLAFFELNSFAPRMNRNQFKTSQCMCFLTDSSCLFGAIKKSSAATSHSFRSPSALLQIELHQPSRWIIFLPSGCLLHVVSMKSGACTGSQPHNSFTYSNKHFLCGLLSALHLCHTFFQMIQLLLLWSVTLIR